MTYLVGNETAALLVPAKFLAQLHPHFREVMQFLAVQVADEARHVEVFKRRTMLRRREALSQTAGLNEEVFDALVILAAGSWEMDAVAAGFEKVQALRRVMAADRTNRLLKLGFDHGEAVGLSELHTRNFM